MALIYTKLYVECSDSVFDGKINDENWSESLLQVQKLMKNLDAWGYPQTISIIEKSSRSCYVNIFPKFRTKVSQFESVVRLVPA